MGQGAQSSAEVGIVGGPRDVAQLEEQLAAAEENLQQAPNPDLLDALAVGEVEVDKLPEDVARRLFEALRLELRYDKTTNRLTCCAWLTGPTMPAAQKAANDAVILTFAGAGEVASAARPPTTRNSARTALPFPSL